MASSALNWSGTALLLIGFALILSAIIYVEAKKTVNTTFRVLLGIGIGLLFLGFIILFAGHWSVFFPPISTPTTITTTKTTKIPTVASF